MKHPKLIAPQIPKVLDIVDGSLLSAEATLEAVQLTDSDMTGLRAVGMSWDEVVLERVTLSGAQLEHLRANDIQLTDCDLSTAQCSEVSLLRAVIKRGRMSGWDSSKGLLKDVEFHSCKLNMANFRFAKLERVRFVDCLLTEADFIGAELKHVEFVSCYLEKVQFGSTAPGKMYDVDLRTSQLVDISGWKHMKGVVIDGSQLVQAAPYIASELGIIVDND